MSVVLNSPIVSQSDRKEYRFLKLNNGLKVLLIKVNDNRIDCEKDPRLKKYESKMAAAAMCIDAGSFQDPKEIQGISHLIEHMIFMGSEKYQKENDFDQFCSSHSGYDNAYTETEHTLFYFDIIEKYLSNALDRFSSLFKAPLMLLESMQREISAIESEFQSYINDDDVRIAHIYASMIYDHHPSSNFIWGNLKTLRDDIDSKFLHEKIHEHRRKYYTADRMFLCVQSSVEMNRIERSVIEHFSSIPCSVKSEQAHTKCEKLFDIFKPDFYEKVFFVKSTSEKCKLLMSFLFPSDQNERNFLEYLAAFIQYEGPGSLSSYFMAESLGLRVKARIGFQNFEGNSYFTMFTIDVNLTSKGYENFDRVLSAIFSFLLLLKSVKNEEHERRYREFKEIKETMFKYRRERAAIVNVQEVALNMKCFEDENILMGRNFYPDFNSVIMKALIDRLNEKKFNILILSDKDHHSNAIYEKWFGTQFWTADFPNEYKKLWNERWLYRELFLPKQNEFICKSFQVFHNPSEKDEKYPREIFHSETCQCFYKMDKIYGLPYGYVHVYFKSNLTSVSVKNFNMTSIYSMCIKNSLSEKLYPATLSGFNYKLNSVETGLILRTSGFNEKLHLIVDIITKEMKVSITKNVFQTFKKELKKNCYNCIMDLSVLNDDYQLSQIKSNHRTFLERYKNIDSIKYEDFKQFTSKFLHSFNVKILIQGNIVKTRGEYIKEIILANLKSDELIDGKEEELEDCINQIPPGSTIIKTESMRKNDFNSIVKNYYQVGKCEGTIADFLVSILTEPLFDTLRTHQQLGYGVSCSLRRNTGMVGITITVEYQENQHSSDFVDNKIEQFLLSYLETLQIINDEDFLAAKKCFIASKLTPVNDLETEVNQNFDEIRNNEHVFDRNEREAIETEKISKSDLLEFYHKIFLSETKRKLSVHTFGKAQIK